MLKHCVHCMIAKMVWRFAWIVLPALLGVWLLGCGLDLSYLNCASKCEDVSAPVTASGSSGGSGIDAGSNGSDAEMTGADMTLASETSDDVSAGDATGTGSGDSGGTGGDAANDAGCFLCGTMACCFSRYQACADGGNGCCSLAGGDCDNGCCAGFVCNAALKCASSCAPLGGNCTTPSDCCQRTYCGPSNTCVPCLALEAGCTSAAQCCTNSCSLSGLCLRGGGN